MIKYTLEKINWLAIVALLIMVLGLFSCSTPEESGKLKVVTTTTMLTDLVKNIGGEVVEVEGLMGAGVDPHLYKASEGDVSKLFGADIIFYSGLHLEGKLVDVFEKMKVRGKETIALGETLDKNQLIGSKLFASNYDPHVWFNIQFFKQFADKVTQILSEADPENAELFKENNTVYQKKLDELEVEVEQIIETLPKSKRILVTAHDAFNYFGKRYGFEVVGLQGISTATEAGVQDVQRLSDFIIEHEVKAIFIESSVPRRTIEALQAAVLSKNHEVAIGGSLYSDALGNPGTEEGTYIGMFKYNVKTIVNALR
ncbi:zinc ABC transporter substrate-binding protein [Membranicola marinus]|uniref:Zinc ABC transporter substrate-binding protein n=1 Tax=Membranihabitans marinus TaxID=1227546 RepID=A0A953HWU6_9BACT|nr:zinc ABC transporter substrate-binding protein [Membranihabitans marinus]MBY5958051.1 zinc ABC transporter substrate-binding protein [Membranihabitans marinus]